MSYILVGILFVGLVELAYMSGYYRWDCPAREWHDCLSRRKAK